MNLLFGTKWFSLPRLACLLITLLLLYFIFQRIDLGGLTAVLKHLKGFWFVLAFAIYGLAMILGGLRWHVRLGSKISRNRIQSLSDSSVICVS